MFIFLSKKSNRKGPKVVTTTAFYMDEASGEESSSKSHSRECPVKAKAAMMTDVVQVGDLSLVKSTWEILKKDGDFAPKVFIK